MTTISFQATNGEGETREYTCEDVPAGIIRTTTTPTPEFEVRVPASKGVEIQCKISGTEEKTVQKFETMLEPGLKRIRMICVIEETFIVQSTCPKDRDRTGETKREMSMINDQIFEAISKKC